MYLTDNEDKSTVAERFIRTLKAKIYKKMTANDNIYCLGYLNKLVDEYKSYHRSIGKKPADADYSALTAKIEKNPKSLKFKVGESKLLSTRILLAKVTPKIGRKKSLLSILC